MVIPWLMPIPVPQSSHEILPSLPVHLVDVVRPDLASSPVNLLSDTVCVPAMLPLVKFPHESTGLHEPVRPGQADVVVRSQSRLNQTGPVVRLLVQLSLHSLQQ